MAFAGVFRAFFSLVALILILLCAFAGSHRYFFATADIVKVCKLTLICRDDSCWICYQIHLPDPTGGNMPQHLSIHVMSICRGTKNNITDCTVLRVPVHSLQTSVLANTQGVLLVEYTISRLAALARTSRLLSMFYVIAIGASGLSSRYWITSFRRRNLGWHRHAAPKHALASNPDSPPSLVEFLSLAVSQRPCYYTGKPLWPYFHCRRVPSLCILLQLLHPSFRRSLYIWSTPMAILTGFRLAMATIS